MVGLSKREDNVKLFLGNRHRFLKALNREYIAGFGEVGDGAVVALKRQSHVDF